METAFAARALKYPCGSQKPESLSAIKGTTKPSFPAKVNGVRRCSAVTSVNKPSCTGVRESGKISVKTMECEMDEAEAVKLTRVIPLPAVPRLTTHTLPVDDAGPAA